MIVTVANPIYDAVFKYLMEDEYFTAIENRDTAIMRRDQIIAEKDNTIAEKDNTIAEKDNTIAEKDKALLVSAKALKQAGIPAEQIAVITTLPIEVVMKI